MMDDYYTHRRAGVNWMRENNQEIDPKGHATDLFTDWTLDYLQKQKSTEKPFFLFLTYNAPHDPVQPPKKWLDKIQQREKGAPRKRQKMIAFVEHLDYNVGRILDQLATSNLDKNTMIVFTSDNGGALQYGASNQSLSGGKGDLLEGGIRVPCLVKLPMVAEEKVIDEPLLLMDFYPSIIQLAGGKKEEELPSEVIPEICNDARFVDKKVRDMVWMRREGHKFGGRIYYAISDGKYKLLQRNPFSEYELFDLSMDPSETKPLQRPKMKRELQKKLTQHIQNSGGIPWQ
jgi:arylsulfatase A-like enzyme